MLFLSISLNFSPTNNPEQIITRSMRIRNGNNDLSTWNTKTEWKMDSGKISSQHRVCDKIIGRRSCKRFNDWLRLFIRVLPKHELRKWNEVFSSLFFYWILLVAILLLLGYDVHTYFTIKWIVGSNIKQLARLWHLCSVVFEICNWD